MSETMLSVADVCEISGLTPKAINWLIAAGAVTPHVDGRPRQGKHRQYSLLQTLGLTVVARLRQQSLQGCNVKGATAILQAFENIDADWLEERFEKNETHLVTIRQNRPLMREKAGDRVDVRACWRHVQDQMRAISERLATEHITGRARGLALAAKD